MTFSNIWIIWNVKIFKLYLNNPIEFITFELEIKLMIIEIIIVK